MRIQSSYYQRYEKDRFNLIHVNDLVGLLKDPAAKPAIFDVNNAETRKRYGVIPGAKLLSSSKSFDANKELPSDKNTQLVFYCANTSCMASHAAADRAVDAGFKHVSVMADGIQGWNKETPTSIKP